MKRTLLSHFWNEGYLLPWWVKHHREMFDEAILINWGSTDDSVKQIKRHAPKNWKIVQTKWNLPLHDGTSFACALDEEIMQYESSLSGWRTCLNTTEFLLGNINKATGGIQEEHQTMVGCIAMLEWNPDGILDRKRYLWDQCWTGRDCRKDTTMHERAPRSMHNHPVRYTPGRHFFPPAEQLNKNLVILHYANCIASQGMLKRRLQIQHRITNFDRSVGFGIHHFYPGRTMVADDIKESIINRKIRDGEDIRPIIKYFLDKN